MRKGETSGLTADILRFLETSGGATSRQIAALFGHRIRTVPAMNAYRNTLRQRHADESGSAVESVERGRLIIIQNRLAELRGDGRVIPDRSTYPAVYRIPVSG